MRFRGPEGLCDRYEKRWRAWRESNSRPPA
jgi:hypothetical protein